MKHLPKSHCRMSFSLRWTWKSARLLPNYVWALWWWCWLFLQWLKLRTGQNLRHAPLPRGLSCWPESVQVHRPRSMPKTQVGSLLIFANSGRPIHWCALGWNRNFDNCPPSWLPVGSSTLGQGRRTAWFRIILSWWHWPNWERASAGFHYGWRIRPLHRAPRRHAPTRNSIHAWSLLLLLSLFGQSGILLTLLQLKVCQLVSSSRNSAPMRQS